MNIGFDEFAGYAPTVEFQYPDDGDQPAPVVRAQCMSHPNFPDRGLVEGYSINHDHPMRPEISEHVGNIQHVALAQLAREHEAAKNARPSKEERAALGSIWRKVRGISAEDHTRLQELRKKYSERVTSSLTDISHNFGTAANVQQPQPAPGVDNYFWWARSDWYSALYQASFNNNILSFTGKVTHDAQDLTPLSFGVTPTFGITPDRLTL